MAASLAALKQGSFRGLRALTRWGCWQQVAVKSICLGVHRGERFGLLGPNGAGDGLPQSVCIGQHVQAPGWRMTHDIGCNIEGCIHLSGHTDL